MTRVSGREQNRFIDHITHPINNLYLYEGGQDG